MTSTLAPPPASRPPEANRAPRPAPRRPDRLSAGPTGRNAPLLVVAEVALAAVTATAVVGLGRLFVDGSFLLPVLTLALAAHLLAAWCRRWALGMGVTLVVAAAGLVASVSWLLLPATTAYGAPTTATLAEAGRQLSAALATFTEVVAPAPVEPGFVLASAIAVWFVAFVADTAAFRAGAKVEAAVPGATLFVFGAALGAPLQRELSTGAFLAGLLAYWLAQRAAANAASPTWLGHDATVGSATLLRAGALLGGVAVVAALVVGPALPGATGGATIPWRASDRDEVGSRVTVSPLVDIQSRIVDQAAAVVFTVDSPSRSYWRLTSLETFDGRIWRSERSYRTVDGDLPTGFELVDTPATTVDQEFEIGALSSIWLPAAYRPVEVAGVEASYDPESASLIVPAEVDVTQVGQRYTITSVLPELTSEALATADVAVPVEVADFYTELPEGFSPAVRDEAARITGGAVTPFDKARALQDHFRNGSFTYSLEVERGHGDRALERFLFESRVGYCEQFAGAYAAMARAVGLPARVAVGFTPGETGPDGRFVVRGANGHAWPEVYLQGYGWVPFEPTPGRGIPGATPYTGVPEQQANLADASTATTLPPTQALDPLDPSAGLDSVAGGLPDVAVDEFFPETSPLRRPDPWPRRFLVAGVVAVAAPALWVALVAVVAGAAREVRRRRAADSPGRRIGLAWDDAGRALGAVGTPPQPWETPREVAARAARAPGVDGRRLAELAESATLAAFAPGTADDGDATRAESAANDVVKGAERAIGPRQRLARAVDPRPHLPRPRARRRIGMTHTP